MRFCLHRWTLSSRFRSALRSTLVSSLFRSHLFFAVRLPYLATHTPSRPHLDSRINSVATIRPIIFSRSRLSAPQSFFRVCRSGSLSSGSPPFVLNGLARAPFPYRASAVPDHSHFYTAYCVRLPVDSANPLIVSRSGLIPIGSPPIGLHPPTLPHLELVASEPLLLA